MPSSPTGVPFDSSDFSNLSDIGFLEIQFLNLGLLRFRSHSSKVVKVSKASLRGLGGRVVSFTTTLKVIQTIATDGVQGQNQQKTRMQVVATAIVYFKRFYLRRSYKDADPYLISCASLILASKVEEHGTMSMSKMISSVPQCLKRFAPNVTYDASSKNGIMYDAEFILVEIMDCCLIVYHPYRPLLSMITVKMLQVIIMLHDLQMSCKDQKEVAELEANAWKVINDSLRTDCNLLYPPHIIACASLLIATELLNKEAMVKPWFQDLSVDMEKVSECVSLITSMYQLWKTFDEKEQLKPLLDKLPKIHAAPSYNM